MDDMSKFNLNLPRMGYFLAYKSDDGFFSRKVVDKQILAGFKKEHANVSHVEVSGGGPYSVNIYPPRAKLVDITKRHKGRYVYILRYKNIDYQNRGRYKVAYFSATLNNTGYDFFGILRFVFKWIKNYNRLWFCSEGALWSLQKEYPAAFDIRPEACMPAHFMRECECVWEGVIW